MGDGYDRELATCSEGLQALYGGRFSLLEGRKKRESLGSKKRTTCWPIPMILFFCQDVFGWIQFQPRLHSLLGRLHGGGCSLLIGSRKEDDSFLIVAFCVGVKKKL